jgi:hypothetical protein
LCQAGSGWSIPVARSVPVRASGPAVADVVPMRDTLAVKRAQCTTAIDGMQKPERGRSPATCPPDAGATAPAQRHGCHRPDHPPQSAPEDLAGRARAASRAIRVREFMPNLCPPRTVRMEALRTASRECRRGDDAMQRTSR